MSEVNTVRDRLDACVEEIIISNAGNISALLLYGSFTYQDMAMEAGSFPAIRGKDGFLDRKPDFIAVVSDLEAALECMGYAYGWGEKSVKKLAGMSRSTPHYFNVETRDAHDVNADHQPERARIPYKMGVVEEGVFMREPSARNFYLPSRLSKPVAVLYAEQMHKVDRQISRIREYFVELALKTLPGEFTGRTFAKRYLHITYLAEAYRVFDIRSKHLKIMSSNVYDFEREKTVSMAAKIEEMIAGKLEARDDVDVIETDGEFYATRYRNRNSSSAVKTGIDFVMFNIKGALTSVKNARTNAAAGGSNWAYLKRKLGF